MRNERGGEIGLGNFHPPHGTRHVAARGHPIPQLVEAVGQVLFEPPDGLAVDACRAPAGLHSLVGLPHLTFADGEGPLWFRPDPPTCVAARGCRVVLGRMGQPLCFSHYEPSSLLRADPPPCPASVLSRSWGLHLRFFLRTGATGSRVPHKSLHRTHATFMPDAARAVNRHPPKLVPQQRLHRGFDLVPMLSTRDAAAVGGLKPAPVRRVIERDQRT